MDRFERCAVDAEGAKHTLFSRERTQVFVLCVSADHVSFRRGSVAEPREERSFVSDNKPLGNAGREQK